jgi:hypothetical protein
VRVAVRVVALAGLLAAVDVTADDVGGWARDQEVDMGENDLARWCENILAAVVACEGGRPAQ